MLRKFIQSILFLALLASGSLCAQSVVPTKGREFWVGYMQNFLDGMPGESLELFVTSDVNTTGNVSIPGQNWNTSFAVTAHSTTTIQVPVALAEVRANQSIQSKGVLVSTADTVSVFAINVEPYTADATKVLPLQSLGTEYRVVAPKAGGAAGAEFLIVATADGTAVEITPTSMTLGGDAPGVPFEVQLDAGDTYLVQAADPGDLSGTLVRGTDASGACRPFAVFAGATCASMPETCAACDHLYDQLFPVQTWGMSYIAVPFHGPDTYSIRITAHEDNTQLFINGVPQVLHAGQWTQMHQLIGVTCVESDRPVQVNQFMEGVECGNIGDPAMLSLNSNDQRIDDITFATVNSDIIEDHALSIITPSAETAGVYLDDILLDPTAFETSPNCPELAFAHVAIAEGSHRVQAEAGATVYVYGNGYAESYAYSAGSYSKVEVVEPPVLCASGDVTLEADPTWQDVNWALLPDSSAIIGSGNAFTLSPPFASGTYAGLGVHGITGCPVSTQFHVEYAEAPVVSFSDPDPTICQGESIAITVGLTGNTQGIDFFWTDESGLDASSPLEPVFGPQTSTVFDFHATSPGGCIDHLENLVVEVVEEDATFDLPDSSWACVGETALLEVPMPAEFTHTWNGTLGGDSYPVFASEQVVLAVESPGGCMHSDSTWYTLIPSPDPGWNLGPAFCALDSVAYALPDPSWEITWENGAADPQWITEGGDFAFSITGNQGCTFQDTISSVVWALPEVILPDEVFLCTGETATIDAITDAEISWEDGSNGTAVEVDAGGFFSMEAVSQEGCLLQDSVWVEALPKPEVDLGEDIIACEGEVIWLAAETGGFTYSWSTGSQAQQIPVSETGVYGVSVSNGFCSGDDQVQIAFVPVPESPLPPDTSWCFADRPLVLEAPNPEYAVLWSNGSASPSTSFHDADSIWVQLTSPLGCEVIYHTNLAAYCPEAFLFIPNAFTPDGDGINDTFGVTAQNIGSFDLQLWNQWGDLIWQTDRIDQAWNGTGDRRGKSVESYVYLYQVRYREIIDAEGTQGAWQQLRGYVTLVR